MVKTSKRCKLLMVVCMTVYSINKYTDLHNGNMLLHNLKKVFHFSPSPYMVRILLITVLLQNITFHFWVTTILTEYQKPLLVSAYEQLEVLHMALPPWLSSFVCVCVCVQGKRGDTAIQKMHFSFVGVHGRTIKFTNSPPCACCGSTG